MEGLRFFALLYFLSIIKFIKIRYIFIDIHYCAGLLFCILNEWAAESFFPWDTYAWYYPISLLFDILIYDDAAVWMTCSAFVGYLLALVCAGQYKKRALTYGVERLVKFTRKDDSFRISPIRKGIASLPYFVAVFAVVYWIEMH